jgi:hypothetical protein
MIGMKAEKYLLQIEAGGAVSVKVRYGFGAAGEEVQRLLDLLNPERIRVKIEGQTREVEFQPGKPFRLADIKQKIKSLSFNS